jgi:hypothetical protein
MGLLEGNDSLYYAGSQQYVANGVQTSFEIENFTASISTGNDVYVYVNNYLVDTGWTWQTPNIVFEIAPEVNSNILVVLKNHSYGGYRYTSLSDIVNNFIVSYVGDGKIISRANRRDVVFQAKRAVQEFSYDISRVEKIQEVELGASLTIPMPRDYVNYVALSYVDDYGVEHPIPFGRISSKPSEAVAQDNEGNYLFSNNELQTTSSITDQRFDNLNPESVTRTYSDYDQFYARDYINENIIESGKRYGGDTELMNKNGMFIIDEANGTFSFSSDLAGRIITIKYISDGLGTDDEMKIHKLAEEAIYKYMAHAILSTLSYIPEYVVARFKRERRAAMRNAKLRLYNLKMSEMTNVMRGKSKQIKH